MKKEGLSKDDVGIISAIMREHGAASYLSIEYGDSGEPIYSIKGCQGFNSLSPLPHAISVYDVIIKTKEGFVQFAKAWWEKTNHWQGVSQKLKEAGYLKDEPQKEMKTLVIPSAQSALKK